MARRRQLADIADGISGHMVRDTPWDLRWPIGEVGSAFDVSGNREFTIDLTNGTVTPASKHLDRLTARLIRSLERHLVARRIAVEWVSGASVELWVSDGVAPRTIVVRCRVSIVDDRGHIHTSTRTGAGPIPVRPFWRYLRDLLFRRRTR